jgi:hypothetical protein
MDKDPSAIEHIACKATPQRGASITQRALEPSGAACGQAASQDRVSGLTSVATLEVLLVRGAELGR